MKRLVIIISLLAAACAPKPTLDNPGIILSPPPEELMVPPEKLDTIPQEPNGRSEISKG